MNLLNTILNAVVAGTVAFILIYAVGENFPNIDPKYKTPEIFGVVAIGFTLFFAAVREVAGIHSNLH